MSFISQRCIYMVGRKQIQFSGQAGNPSCISFQAALLSSTLERLCARRLGTYKHLFKRSFRSNHDTDSTLQSAHHNIVNLAHALRKIFL